MRKVAFLFFMFLFVGAQTFAQEKTVTGIVTDEKDGSPLVGVSVTVKGTNTGTTTGRDGTFSLSVPSSARTLVFSFINFSPQEVSIGNRASFSIKMSSEEKALAEVVVVGYGTIRKKDLTGSVSRVSGEKIKDLPVQSFEQALSGRMAGVSITLPNGVVNNPPVIRIRGVNSVSLSSFPLVVIDGVPTFTGNTGVGNAANNVLGDVNPADIESVEVLKDAAAAAIYGSRASAGVLLITTKKGKQGKAKVVYDGWVGWTQPFNLVPLLDGRQYETIKNEGLVNAGTPPNNTSRGFYPVNDVNGNPVNTDWYDFVYRTGLAQSHNVSVSGATEKTNYFLSGGYTKQEGMIEGNDFNRTNVRLSLDQKVNNWLTLGGTFGYSNSRNRAPNTGGIPGSAFNISGLGRLAFVLAPNVPARNIDGSYNLNLTQNTIGQGNNRSTIGFTNPAFILDNNKFSSDNDRILANGYVNIKLTEGLSFKTIYGIDYLNVVDKQFRAALHGDGVQFGGANSNIYQSFRRWNLQNLVTFNRSFGNHNINILAGNEQQYTMQEGWGADRRVLVDPYFDEYQGAFGTIVPAGNFFGENYLVSFFGRVNYNYDRKYLFSVNGRRDGYSAFSTNRKYGNFGGISAGYVITEETFFKNSGLADKISNLKVRGSYGVVGNNQGLADFPFQTLYNGTLYGSGGAFFLSQAGNPDLTWETSQKTDVGIEAGFLNNRFSVEANYYINNIDNLIIAEPQAPSRGLPGGTIFNNVGSMTNRGIELSINAFIFQDRKVTWTTNFNITTLRNKVTSLSADGADIFPSTSGLERPSIIRVGESIGSFYAVRTAGVNPANGQRIFVYRDGTQVQYNHAAPTASRWTLVSTGAVAPRGADQANDGVIIGPALPKWTGGWDHTVRYKTFDLNVLLFFSGGNYIYNGTKAGLRDQRFWNNAEEVMNRWQKPGTVTDIPRVVFNDNISNGSAIVISENVERGDFVKLRNVSLGYTLPTTINNKLKITGARFYIQAQNAFTLTGYSGFDPEVSTNGNGNGNASVDRNSVPQARTITVGVNVNF